MGGLHFVIALCVVVTMEVLTNSVNEWNVAVSHKARECNDWHFNSVDSVGKLFVIQV